jgi:hypothetical protein
MVMKEVCSLDHRKGNEEVSTLRTLQGNAALELLGQCADQLQAKGVRRPEIEVVREPAAGIPDPEHKGLLGRYP